MEWVGSTYFPLRVQISADSEVMMAERWADRVTGTSPNILEIFYSPYASWKWKGTLLCFCKYQHTSGGGHIWADMLWTLTVRHPPFRISLQGWEWLSDQCPQARTATVPGRISQTLATRLSAPSYRALASPEGFRDGVNFLSPFASLPLAHERHHQDKVSREGSCSVNNQSINELSPLFP